MQSVLVSLLFGLITGACDASGYLLLQQLLPANITGDLVLLGADWAAHSRHEEFGRILAIPFFLAFVWLGRQMAGELRRRGLPAIRLVLLAGLGLLAAFMTLGLIDGPFSEQNAANTLTVGMIGVAAMALMNVVARLWRVLESGSTAMTGNSVKLLMDLAELSLGLRKQEPDLLYDTLRLAVVVTAFVAGCALAALVYLRAGPWCTALPFGFAVCITVLCLKYPP
ncbi:MAG TPA: YoaK family protein [Stellaceae bacterium]|nr:YoaK family protein [Stellaceae bacterium]